MKDIKYEKFIITISNEIQLLGLILLILLVVLFGALQYVDGNKFFLLLSFVIGFLILSRIRWAPNKKDDLPTLGPIFTLFNNTIPTLFILISLVVLAFFQFQNKQYWFALLSITGPIIFAYLGYLESKK